MRSRIAFLAALVLCAASGATARADSAALLSLVVEPGLPATLAAEAEREVVAYAAGKPAPLSLISLKDAQTRLSQAGKACAAPNCAGQAAAALNVDYVVLLHVFAPEREGLRGSMRAGFVGHDGVVYTGTSELGADGVGAATRRALVGADERYLRGPGPWLRIRAPQASRVRVDAGALHEVPYLERHGPGLHRVVVLNREGATLYDSVLTLSDDAASYEELDVTGDAKKPVADSFFSRRRSPLNWYVGVPITALGVALLSVGIVHFVKKGDCANDDCSELNTVNAGSKAMLGIGAALTAIGGTAFLGVGVIRERETVTGASLHLHKRF